MRYRGRRQYPRRAKARGLRAAGVRVGLGSAVGSCAGTGGVSGQYICYDNNPALDYASSPATNLSQHDLNVIVLYTYGPLTPLVTTQFGTFHLAVNEHMTVQGP